MFQGVRLLSLGPIPVFGSFGTTAEAELLPEDELLLPLPALDAHVGPLMVLAFSVTVPADSAKTRPFKVAPVFKAVTSF